MADSSYESEVHGIEAFLSMQRNKDSFKNTTAAGGVSNFLYLSCILLFLSLVINLLLQS